MIPFRLPPHLENRDECSGGLSRASAFDTPAAERCISTLSEYELSCHCFDEWNIFQMILEVWGPSYHVRALLSR